MSGEEEEELVMLKLQVIQRSGRDHTRAQMALIAVYGTLFLEERR